MEGAPFHLQVTSTVAIFFLSICLFIVYFLLGCVGFVSAQGISDFHSGSHDLWLLYVESSSPTRD